jgi:hypothetical protein
MRPWRPPEQFGLPLAKRRLVRARQAQFVAEFQAGRLDDLPAHDVEVARRDVEGFKAGKDEDPDPVVVEDTFHISQIEFRQPAFQ